MRETNKCKLVYQNILKSTLRMYTVYVPKSRQDKPNRVKQIQHVGDELFGFFFFFFSLIMLVSIFCDHDPCIRPCFVLAFSCPSPIKKQSSNKNVSPGGLLDGGGAVAARIETLVAAVETAP